MTFKSLPGNNSAKGGNSCTSRRLSDKEGYKRTELWEEIASNLSHEPTGIDRLNAGFQKGEKEIKNE